jgi:GAF domain-containing protein
MEAEESIDDLLARRDEQIRSLHAEVELLNSLASLSHVLHDDVTQLDLLHRVTRLSAQALPGIHAGVTVGHGTNATTAAASDPLVADLDAVEVELGEGPCIEAMTTGAVVKVDDMTIDQRWPGFAAAAIERGVISSMGLPLVVRDEVIGALNLYALTPRAFAAREMQLAAMLAEQAAFALGNIRLYESSSRLAEQLREALATRGLIEQAKGILMAKERCDEDEAFDILRRASQRTNRKLRDIARQVVDGARVKN